jgi:argininosuccinate lyase
MKSAASEGFILATDLADALSRQGIPFRVSHGIVGNLVKECEARGIGLDGLDEKDLSEMPEVKAYADILCKEIGSSLSVERSVAARKHSGGTAGVQVEKLLKLYKEKIAARKDGDK